MFRGVNALNLDSKGRLAIPTRYRDGLVRHCNGQMVLTVDRDHCLLLYPLPDWEEIERKLVRLPGFNKQARRLQRLLIGHATECELDANGRILLPPPLREFANLLKAVVLIGQGNKFEIWNEDAWNARRAEWLMVGEEEGKLPPDLESLSL
ncbi:MAG: cell division/cell wall cluster transcriptional repressor MraZ [Candidatus Muproteobacteria bacterium RIFCSPHIGHO2_01_FULL_65_16]|uniref:Transcriptional regulator MraZ n=3 Tax=Candidatus Muproteobacteria TaxID=1817795 RepID=A0A1F6TCM0_9PROT|nr:MAG: cell division/cell wall cluster transcriptional repressor MraZ [Candidatus Muproteobacteria bacterium RBG_16_65_31]OGI48001.1 MAG: cell division/cell wall cluster transcriptional repressor MraZ [Candidatus Muproteobacteria bacterium RIFCSPHIGHO2_01_FULL_65_16]OGI52876.1 MAG: cell division/cell wall cluster transcriptional repressor MraZ [Candidatus Muproteobacteria bacterium RIFCSPHIGHO2_02_FULL_65_16]